MDEDAVRDRLRSVDDPDLGDDSGGQRAADRASGHSSRADIVSLGLVNAIDVDDDAGSIRISLALGAPYSPAETEIASRVREELSGTGYDVELSAGIGPDIDPEEDVLPGVENIVAVASGKGGVGKSTVAVNLAAGLSELGARVGLFDADIYGPNVPRMVDADQAPTTTGDQTIVPPEQYGIKLMSMAFLVGDDDPVIWRGPMVHKLLTQLVEDVQWGELDYLVLDLPPGTGDTQLTVLQTLPLTGAVIVTTPQDVAIDDAQKGLEMFGKHDTPVLGIVENMSSFRCPDCESTHDIFGAGGGEAFAADNDLPLLGSLPLDPSVRTGGDDGRPVVLDDGDTADAFRVMTENAADMAGVVRRREAMTRR